MKDFFSNLFERLRLSSISKSVNRALANFSLGEMAIFVFAFGIALISLFFIFSNINDKFLNEIPKSGGEINEGVIGSPRYINPLLAFSDTDRDLVSLIYSGLMKIESDGSISPDLAEKYEVSEDGKTYTFTIKDDAKFQDGVKVTADDVVFTIQKIEDPAIKSPKRANWDGVTVEKVDDKTVKFTLTQPYAPFLENTNLGILPKHIWKGASSEEFAFSNYDLNPIGSGPYKIQSTKRNSSGIPETYTLTPYEDYISGKAYVNIVFHFYSNEKDLMSAYQSGNIDATRALSKEATKNLLSKNERIERYPLPQIFAVFFNQSKNPVLMNTEIRKALNDSVDRNAIINKVLYGFGTGIHGPIPPGLSNETSVEPVDTKSPDIDLIKANLEKSGWKMGTDGIYERKVKTKTERFAFALSTGDSPELKNTAYLLKEQWKQIGADVDVKIFEGTDLNQNVLRPRKYDAILFGEIIGRELDIYAFWHSSQRLDPGLNIAQYTNSKVDSYLEAMRSTNDESKKQDALNKVSQAITNDIPAVFLFSPDLTYILPDTIKGFVVNKLTSPSERFINVRKWYIDTDRVWSIFVPKN